MRYKILVMIISFFILCNYVSCDMCDNSDIERLKVLANNVSVDYTYDGGDENYQNYQINFTGLGDELYAGTFAKDKLANNDSEYINLDSGKKYIGIYSKNCSDYRLRIITVDLLKYNEYSDYGSCYEVSYDDLPVCDPWYQGDLTYDSFNEAVNDYYASKNKTEDSISTTIYKFIVKYLIIIIPVIIILLFFFIFLIIKRIKKNRLD